VEFDELLDALQSSRGGAMSPSGREEAVPMSAPDGNGHRIGIRVGKQVVAVLEPPWDRTVALSFSTDGARLAAAGAPSGVCVWQVKSGARVAHLPYFNPWILQDRRECLPVRFAVHDQFLLVGGRALTVVETSGWSTIPVADFPVVALVADFGGNLIIGPPENGAYPLECLSLDTFTLSYRGSVGERREHPSTSQLDLG
jgi:hypothetical protein